MVELVPGVFVAREAELGVLERAAAGCRDGVGSAIVVAGEAGVGKSRLLWETSLRARDAGMLVLRGRAASGAGQAPFRAVAEALAGGCVSTRCRKRACGALPRRWRTCCLDGLSAGAIAHRNSCS
ncbi:MAG: ATP-binding protein [Solirubrobacterales bacterium]|nr:ATP-binding protein [Solirubrobacterales bacterium]